MVWLHILVGVFVGGAVAAGRRGSLLWLWGIPFAVVVGSIGTDISEMYGGVGPVLGFLWLVGPLVALAIVLKRDPKTIGARLAAGSLAVLGSIVAVVVALAVSLSGSTGGGLEQFGVLILSTVFFAFPLGAAAGLALAQRVSARSAPPSADKEP